MASIAVQTSSTSLLPPPPSPLTHPIKYDVFLSFRGADTRPKFTDHLYNELQVRQGIPTFRDSEELEKGQDLSQLFEAIEKSKIAVVILSSNYASSTWCLREVAKIVECRSKSGLIVLPVFYDIEPAQVRYQTGKFKEYFDKHEKRCKDSIGEVESWKQALTEVAGLSGWDLKDSLETTVIEEIVKCVDRKWKLKFNPAFSIEDSKDFVGLDRVRKIEIDLDIIRGSDKVGVIGICGMPGVGKTTIAEVVFRRNWHHFEANSFIANVGETRKKKNSLLHIQNQLYHDLLDSKVITINDVPAERRKLSHKKVLIILDGVTELDFIVELVGRGGEELINWFGRGSRIIITTIDEKLLERYKAKIHKVERLNENEARLLFFRKTFNKDQPLHDFANLSYKFVDFADGLPLAIVALGSLLLERTLDEWKAELRTLEANNYTGYEKLFVILTVCINGLRSGAKDIFLDIACFFKGDDKKRAERIFESCGHNPVVNLKILLEKSLVTIVGGKLWMHDLLQETGQKMVIGKPELELGKRSRLWHHKEAISVLKQDKGTSAVRGIFLRSPRLDKVRLKADSFSNMDFLRLLKIKNVIFSGCLEYDLSNELSLLEWHSFASTSLPSNFEPKKLVELHLPQSQIKQLWEDTTTPRLEKLVIMDLSDCKYLISTPDFQSVPNLESLILKGCTRLSEVHLPDGNHLQKLILLNLEGCDSISSLPNGICSLRSLTTLILSGCSKLANLPEKIGENMTQLSELDLDGTAIKELPASIKHLTGLIRLNLRDCKNLLSLPAMICSLTKLQVLNLSGCSKLDKLPENLGSLVGLKELDASRSCIRPVPSSILLLKDLESLSFRGCGGLQLPASFSGLESLTKLDLSYCKLSDGAIPADLDCLSSLDHLNLSGNSLVSIPESITKLSKLEVLLLNDCSRLRSLPNLPSSIRRVFARNCPLLGTYSNKLTVWTSTATGFCFINSQTSEERKLQRIPISEQHLMRPQLQKFYEDIIYKGNGFEYITPHTKIPSWFDRQSEGSSITIPLPPDYFNGELELMGFALCFVYEAQDHENMESTASTISAQQVKYSCNYTCHLSTCGGPDDDYPLLVCKLMDHDYVGSFRHWVYISGGLFAERLNNRYVRAQVIIDRPGVEVKACGASLIYSGGVTEFVWNLNLRDEILSHMRNLSSGDQKENPNDQSIEQEEEETTEHHRYQLELKHVPVQNNDMFFLFDTKGRNKQSLDHDTSRTGISTQVPHQRLERLESNDQSNKQEQGTNSQLTHVAESGCASDTRDNSTSTKIVGDQLRKNVESFLEGLFEPGGKARINEIGFIFSHQAILPWFNCQSIGNVFLPGEKRIGSVVGLPLPPELYNNKEWVGFALYVSFTLPPGVWREKSCCFFSSSLYTCDGVRVHSLKLWSYGEDNFMGSHRFLVIHIPRRQFGEQLNQCRSICATFVSDDSLTPSVEAEMCGIRVVYEQDLKGLIQTITECTIASPPAVYYGLTRSFVLGERNSYFLVVMKNNLIEAAESSERRLSTLQEPLKDSEFISDQQIYLEIQAGFPYIPLKNKDSVVEGKRNLELLLERFFALSADLRVKLTLNGYACSFSVYCNPLPCSESMVSKLPPNLENDVNLMQKIKQCITSFFDNEDVIRANLVDYSEDGTTCSSDGTTPVRQDFDRFSIYNCCFPPNEIVEWFGHNSNGPSVEIPLPPNSTDWIGLALCAYFEVLDRPTSNLDSLNPGNPHHLTCYFETETDRDSPESLHAYCTSNEEFQWLHLGGFLWLSYIPRTWFLDYHQLNKCINLKATIASDGQGLGVLKCGLRLLYQHDEQEFKETIMHCKRLLLFDLNNGKNKQHSGVSGETGSSGGNSDIAQTHNERLDIPIKGKSSFDISAEERDSYGTTPVFPGETSGKSNHQLELGASSTSPQERGKSHLMQLITGNVVEERGPGTDLIPFFIEIEPPASSTKITGQLRGNIESSLEQLFQGGNARHYHYGFILSPRVGAVMPWFSHHTIGKQLTYIMDLPRDLHKDKKWVGFALYVAFTQSPNSDFGCECGLFGFPGNTVISVITWCPVQFSGSQPRLCFIHIPRAHLPEQCNDSTIFAEFAFHPPAASEVEMCGMHVVYDEDVKGLVETITQSTFCSPHPVYFSQDDKTEISPRGNPVQIITMATSLVTHSKACIEPTPGGLVPSQKFGKVELLILINGDTPFKKKDTIEWKRNFELLLQSFFRLDLVIKFVLGQDILARYEDSSADSCLFPQKEIPDWFTEKSLTSTFVTRLPDDLESDNNWMGFVVCAAFSVHPHPTDVGNYKDSELNSHVKCNFRWSSDPSRSMWGRDATIGVRPNNKFIWLSRRGFIFLRFIPCRNFNLAMMDDKSHRQLEASFESGSPALAVQKCSLRILYKQDVQEYKQTLIHCFASVYDNLDHSPPNKEDDSQHNKEPIHEDYQIDSFGTTSLSEDTQHETKTTVPVPQSETSANSFNHFNSILFKPILYDNKTAVIFADFRGWEE